ncbi:MAG: hypothetical protein H6Q55_3212 [Deltaproteobacteria bacterium]|nr:hypothetical protein [Deltaproteobacteria bacterium]
MAKSAEAQVPWLRIAQLRVTHSSTGIARGLLRRRISKERYMLIQGNDPGWRSEESLEARFQYPARPIT